jgi:hypothetical protein
LIRCLYYSLLAQNVKASKLEFIIREVLKTFCLNLKVARLPTASTASSWRSELNAVTLIQAGETFAKGKKDSTLQQDDTTKEHQGYSAFEVSYLEGKERKVITLGIERSWEKNADGVARVYCKVLDDVETATAALRGEAAGKEARVNLAASMPNTMTDRGAVAKSFAGDKYARVRLQELLASAKFPDFVLEDLEHTEEEFRKLPEGEQLKQLVTRNFTATTI